MTGPLCWVGVGEEDDVADNGCSGRCDDEGSADPEAFGDDGVGYCEDCGKGVGWDCEELSLPVGISEGYDDRWLRER